MVAIFKPRIKSTRRSLAFSIVSMQMASPAVAQAIHVYETLGQQLFGLALPLLCIAVSFRYLVFKANMRVFAGVLALLFATFLGFCFLLIYLINSNETTSARIDDAAVFTILVLLASPWPLAVVALFSAGWGLATKRDVAARAARESAKTARPRGDVA